ncbi:hypothetical protein ACJX0J_039416, partial [Zea mays]
IVILNDTRRRYINRFCVSVGIRRSTAGKPRKQQRSFPLHHYCRGDEGQEGAVGEGDWNEVDMGAFSDAAEELAEEFESNYAGNGHHGKYEFWHNFVSFILSIMVSHSFLFFFQRHNCDFQHYICEL